MKEFLRGAFRAFGYRITTVRPQNRFQAMEESLSFLKNRGYQPRVVIDAGANEGSWTKMARLEWRDAAFHLIEPQPACAATLRELISDIPKSTFHPYALTEPGQKVVRMIGGGTHGGGTGAWIAREGEMLSDQVTCPATTLDELLGGLVTRSDRALLKLDLEGHELPALCGADKLLGSIEVIVTELQVYEINRNGRPVIADYINFLSDRGFEFYDIACLSPRTRDQRLRMADVLFVRRDSDLVKDCAWE